MNAIVSTRFTRRAAIATGGAFVIGLTLPIGALKAQPAPNLDPAIDPNVFVKIAPDSSVTVLVKHIEFGQGPNTGLATLVAEELDADWSQMRAESAPGNTKLYANLLMGAQLTGGSSAIANSYMQMRRAGATARAMLVMAAARKWRVPASEVTVTKGVIAHPSGKSGRFGEFAADAATLTPPKDVKFKEPSAFTLIGKAQHVGKLDSVAKSTGAAQFSIDVYEPDMLTVLVVRPPRFGAKVVRFDAGAALAIPGVKAVKAISNGVAVFADSMWAAMKGRDAVTVDWNSSATETRSSDEMLKDYAARTRTPGKVAARKGDVAAAMTGADMVEAEFAFPYLAHATMEPLDGYLEWDGKQAHARFGSQGPSLDQPAIAKVLGIAPEAVHIDVLLAGGSFGRRAQVDAHFAVELAECAKAIGPGAKVKLLWTREDDIQGAYYRPLMVHRFQAAIRDGAIAAWSNTVCGQSFAFGGAFEPLLAPNGIDSSMVEGASKLLYDLPAFQCDVHVDKSPIAVTFWRSVGHAHTGYAVECFVDLLLAKMGKDPVAGRLEMMAEEPRAAGVLKAVAQAAGWNGAKVGNGRARGVAVVESFNTFVAQIAEVSMGENGEPRVHKVWCAVDCGVAVNPDVIRAQMACPPSPTSATIVPCGSTKCRKWKS